MTNDARKHITLRTEKTTTITIGRTEIDSVLKRLVDAPAGARVEFDGSYIDIATVSWTETTEEDVA